jgi:hypothetical protein
MAIVYPQAQDPRLQPVQMPMQVNAPVAPSQISGTGLSREQIMMALQSQNPLLAAASDRALAAEREQVRRQAQETQQRQAQEAMEVSQQADAQASAAMTRALPSDAELPVEMKEGGLVKQAQKVQQEGRNGDSMLVHMNPDQYRAMTALGGLGGLSANQVTINPETGLPEMFSFKDVLPTIVGIAGAAFGLPTWAVALGTGATTAITTGDIGKGLMAGLGSFALGSLAESFGASAANQGVDAAAQQALAANAPVATTGVGTAVGQSVPLGASTTPFGEFIPSPLGGYGSGSFPDTSSLLAPGASPIPSTVGFTPVAPPFASTSAPVLTGGRSMLPGAVNQAGNLTSSGASNVVGSTVQNLKSSPFVLDTANFNFPGMATGGVADPAFQQGVAESITGMSPSAAREALTKQLSSEIYRSAPVTTGSGNFGIGDFFSSSGQPQTKLDLLGEGISKIGTPGGVGYGETAVKGLGGLGLTAGSMGAFDPPEYDYSGMSPGGTRRRYMKPDIAPLDREVNLEGFDASRAGIDPQFQFFAKDGKKGELDTVYAQTGYSDIPMAQQSMSQPQMGSNPMMPQTAPQAAQMQSAIMQAAREVASNSAPQAAAAPRPRTIGLTPNAAANAVFGVNQNVRMQEGGVPSEAMMAQQGIMDIASDQVKNNLNERMSVTPSADQPQNVEERAIYDRAMLAVQGMLEPEEAQMAVEEFIETFGAEAYNMIKELARNPRDEGGVVKPANGNTTVADGAMQGEDIIAGKIIDPDTGEETANLRVGENEYIEPADSLSRRAMAAGLPGTPENGARVRGMEEEQLRQAFG